MCDPVVHVESRPALLFSKTNTYGETFLACYLPCGVEITIIEHEQVFVLIF